VRSIAGACLAATMAATLGAQAIAPPVRVLSARTRTFISVDALIADVVASDVVFLNESSQGPNVQRVEAELLQALAGRRDVVLALDAVDRAAQEPLEHFQMEHLSDDEFLAQSKMPADAKGTYLPLMKLAVARRWPIVATGGTSPNGDGAVAEQLIEAITIGSTGGKRPLLVSLHAGADRGVIEAIAKRVLAQSPGRRAVTLQLEAVPSLETLTPLAAAESGPTYVVYTLPSR
jgi:hypothetical protein